MTVESGEQAVANARRFQRYPQGYCLRFVREAWKIGSLYGSAIEAWYGARDKHRDRQVPVGFPVYYSGGRYGHIVVFTAHGQMRSTDCPSAGYVSETDLDWPVRHWGQTYLGWSGDLNGVELPLQGDEEMNDQDWKRMEELVRSEVAKVWDEKMTVKQQDGDEESKSREQVLRETYQTVKRLQ